MNRKTPKGGSKMRKTILSPLFRIGALLMFVTVALAVPQFATAATNQTSSGATIINAAKATYTSGATSGLVAVGSTTVTVATISSAPTVTASTNQSTVPGGSVTYTFTILNNSNGPETFTIAANALTHGNYSLTLNNNAGQNAAGGVTASLWAGTILSSTANSITVPYGSTTGLAAGSVIRIQGNDYTIAPGGITAGAAPTVNMTTGAITGETSQVITFNAGPPNITAGAGTPVGQTGTITLSFTAATLASGTTGTFDTTKVKVTGSATSLLSDCTLTTAATTTVTASTVSVTKKSKNITTGVPAAYAAAGVLAKPGDIIEYQITVKNEDAVNPVSSVTLTDPLPVYTTYVANSTKLNGIATAGDGASSALTGAGLLIDADGARVAGVAATGNLAASASGIVTYQVQVK
jgi:uncharacterized repeat protein (TIGR01451 family)